MNHTFATKEVEESVMKLKNHPSVASVLPLFIREFGDTGEFVFLMGVFLGTKIAMESGKA